MALLDNLKLKIDTILTEAKATTAQINTSAKSKISAFLALFKKDLSDLWNDHKLFFILFGVVLVIVKFRDSIIDLLLSGAHREFDAAQKKDDDLKAQEDAANNKANQLIQESNDLANSEKPVTPDWNKK